MKIKPKYILSKTWVPFHKSSYKRYLLNEVVEHVLNYVSNEFVALTNLCETGPWNLELLSAMIAMYLLSKHKLEC